ncbi:hypothetical protein G3T36_07085 [Diaminobutyricibacter tongyongensis]|uniref:Carboxypeptidase regulatory-like domain-containing protein n=1 Tax=Leifsonia tongyongensis TaxID=1268043 RepID=A0A6L9XWK7_9MICO|nr:hypothetical protein [Diaminobutyricibacter tongyongensis]NEN05635.1 hypothetical protein [Diaminobutyricibacter tongyongensis]
MRKFSSLVAAAVSFGLLAGALAGPAAAEAVTAPLTGAVTFSVEAGAPWVPAAVGEVSVSYEFSTDGTTWEPPTPGTTNTVAGTMSFPALVYGHYRFTFADVTNTNLGSVVKSIDIVSPNPYTRVDVVLPGKSTISGTVMVNGDDNVHPRLATAGEVHVYLFPLQDGQPVSPGRGQALDVTTDGNGAFSIPGVDTADFAFTLELVYEGASSAYPPLWWGGGSTSAGAKPIAAAGAPVPPLTATMQRVNEVAGTVVDTASHPVASLAVCVVAQTTPSPFACGSSPNFVGTFTKASTYTDSAGHFSVMGLADGTYAVAYGPTYAWGFPYAAESLYGRNTYLPPNLITVSGGKLVDAGLTMLKTDTVDATLKIAGWNRLEQADNGNGSVHLQQLDPSSNAWIETGRWYYVELGGGTASLYSLLPGTYRLDFVYEGFDGSVVHKLSAPVTFTAEGQTIPLSMTLVAPIRSGAAVKSPTSATVYLVDASNLIPVDSMSTLTDLGFSTTTMVLPQSRLDAYSTTHSHLSDAVTCRGGTYLGAQGRLHKLTATAAAALAHTSHGTTPLDDLTCARLTIGTTAPDPVLLQATGSSSVYMIASDGTKRPFVSMADLAAVTAPKTPQILGVSSYYLNQFRTGGAAFPPARLVKSSASSTIFVTDGSRLVPLTSFGTASDAGISTSYEAVAPTMLAGYTIVTSPLRNVVNCDGATYLAGAGRLNPVAAALVSALPSTALGASTCSRLPRSTAMIGHALFVKSANDSTIYYLNAAGQKQRVFSMATVAKLSAPDPARYVTVNDQFLGSMPLGTDLLTPGLLVKSPTSTSIYVADGSGGLVPLRSFTTATDLGLSAHYVTTTAATMSTLKVSAVPLNNLVTCSGASWIGGAGKLWSIDPSVTGSLPVSALPASLFAVLPKSAVALGTAVFITSATSATVYTLESGVKHPVSAWATLVRLAAGKPVTVLSLDADFVSRIPTGTVRR